VADAVRLRPYRADDLETAILLWQRAWSAAMPEIDFTARLPWWRERWISKLVPNNSIIIAEHEGRMAGFVVIDARTGWLDQIVVEPALWGAGLAEALLSEAKRIAKGGIALDVNQSNLRAVRFYERMGFQRTGEGVNSISGAPTFLYAWKPER
jgi:putative acetyltransferase